MKKKKKFEGEDIMFWGVWERDNKVGEDIMSN